MARVSLEGGKWFDPDKAERWQEDTRWNGNNHISIPTGSQWNHERLYRTKSGLWVLYSWSQWQGSTPRHEVIGEAEAIDWLILNDRVDEIDNLNLELQKRIMEAVEAKEV